MNTNHRLSVFGLPVDNLSFDETILEVEKMIQSRKPHQHVVVNMNKLLYCREDKKFDDIIKKCSLINADGMSIVWLSHLLHKPLKERITGMDLMERLVPIAEQKGYSVYFLGARQEIIDKVVNIYKQLYPQLIISGFRNGYWDKKKEKEVVTQIKEAKPDILFVGISSPTKEYFLHNHLSYMNIPFAMGVGGSFDVVAGIARRAPLWMQNYGLEWFFRFIQEPGRLWKRYLKGNIMFAKLITKAIIRKIFR